MLCLSRKRGERIQIGADVSIVVLGVRGKNIRLGIEAPKEIPIQREELRAANHDIQP